MLFTISLMVSLAAGAKMGFMDIASVAQHSPQASFIEILLKLGLCKII